MRDFFHKAMHRLYLILGYRHCQLYLWKKFKIFAKNRGVWTNTTTTFYQFQAMLSKRTAVVVPNMDLLNGNECTARLRKWAEEMLQEARQPKHEGYQSIHGRWHKDDQYRNSWSLIGWTEEQIIEHDDIALEDHSYVATKCGRIQNTKHWVLRFESRWCSTITKSTT